ncbi:Fpg/Nei family DNA glycosylase [Nocardioides aestuarii]|uniref:DNA-(apurinic or apyrimidinic site) lyase n=1 Tax=Nocardioides aestuarii TaxID=252231 RepID=A0ABW4TUQ8_9ACTN
MPEGDAVVRTARRLDRVLQGRTLTATDFRVPRFAVADLSGGLVTGTHTRGKHLLTRIELPDRQWTLHTHLKMEGSWRDFAPGQRWSKPWHTARVVLTTAERVAVGFSLGVVELLPRDREESVTDHLGPDVLGDDWDAAEAVRRLSDLPADLDVRDALLEQRCLAGVGTMWAAEALFATRVHPRTPVGEVADLEAVVTKAQELMAKAVRRRPTTTYVYGRRGQPCPRCRTPIRTAKTGPLGKERPAYWCPVCQAEPRDS